MCSKKDAGKSERETPTLCEPTGKEKGNAIERNIESDKREERKGQRERQRGGEYLLLFTFEPNTSNLFVVGVEYRKSSMFGGMRVHASMCVCLLASVCMCGCFCVCMCLLCLSYLFFSVASVSVSASSSVSCPSSGRATASPYLGPWRSCSQAHVCSKFSQSAPRMW